MLEMLVQGPDAQQGKSKPRPSDHIQLLHFPFSSQTQIRDSIISYASKLISQSIAGRSRKKWLFQPSDDLPYGV